MKISIIIAVFQNVGTIKKTYEKLEELFNDSLSEYDYEIIFIDDGSDDGSLDEILDVKNKDAHVKAITFTKNFGQMAAIIAGLQESSGDVVINISADLQDPIELIPQMVQKWSDGSEIVICHREDRSDSFSAKLFSRMAYKILRFAIPSIPNGGFDYVLIDRKVVDTFLSIDIRNRFFQGDLLWAGYRTNFIPYKRLKRPIGKSQYNFNKKYKNFLDGFLDSSFISIRIISLVGICISLLSMLYGISIILAWINGQTPFTGWAPLMLVILFIGGLIIIMLGIIGEYIWRIYDEVRKKPNFIIREKFL